MEVVILAGRFGMRLQSVVKDVYQTVISSVKGTDEWTDAKKTEVLELAKTKLLASLSSEGYKFLKGANWC